VLDTRTVLMYLGLELIARPLLSVVLAEALCGCTQQELLVYVLSSALPKLVEKKVRLPLSLPLSLSFSLALSSLCGCTQQELLVCLLLSVL
jgi:hypothetical protein